MKTDFKTLLQRSFDEPLTQNEKLILSLELERNPELQAEKESIESIRNLMGTYKPGFDSNFTEKVFERLSLGNILVAPNQLWRVFKRTGLLAAAAIIILLMMVYWHDQSLNLNSLLGIADLRAEDFENLFANH
jgi:hypothetical protein